MPDLTYSKKGLEKRLAALPKRSRIAFGNSCCERMFPNDVAFKRDTGWGDERPLRTALDELWGHAEGASLPASRASELISGCEVVGPSSEEFSALLTTAAQDVCFAICSLLDDAFLDQPERTAQASAYAVDTIDLFVQEEEHMIPNSPDIDDRIRLHPLMQRELKRQDEDLTHLERGGSPVELRERWRGVTQSNVDI